MKTLPLLSLLCWLPLAAAAQPPSAAGEAPLRSEFFSYDIREHALSGKREQIQFYVPFSPQVLTGEGSVQRLGQSVRVPQFWNNRDMYLHIENPGAPFTLYVNEQRVASATDTRTPLEFYISPYVTYGENAVVVAVDAGTVPQPEASQLAPRRPRFENSYIYSQPKLGIFDYTVDFAPDSTGTYGILRLEVVAQNTYNYPESVTVGFDIYDPAGKLQEFNLREVRLQGRSRDTVRFEMPIYKTAQWLWSAERPRLYSLMLFTKRDGQMTEYIPLKVGFGRTEFAAGRILRNGEPIDMRAVRYNAAATAAATEKELRALKKEGVNTLCVDFPQIYWFYDLCERLGFYVIESANIRNERGRDDRTVGGTPSNDPRLLDEYLSRVQRMYLRNRNRTCIVGWAPARASGNGYNLYKAYQWYKSQGDARPMVYDDADGEWNSDMELPLPH